MGSAIRISPLCAWVKGLSPVTRFPLLETGYKNSTCLPMLQARERNKDQHKSCFHGTSTAPGSSHPSDRLSLVLVRLHV